MRSEREIKLKIADCKFEIDHLDKMFKDKQINVHKYSMLRDDYSHMIDALEWVLDSDNSLR